VCSREVVIPAKAGIQTRRGHKVERGFHRGCLWAPAFAGATGGALNYPHPSPLPQAGEGAVPASPMRLRVDDSRRRKALSRKRERG